MNAHGARGPNHVFHFVGHALFAETDSAGYVVLAADAGLPALRNAGELADLLADHATDGGR